MGGPGRVSRRGLLGLLAAAAGSSLSGCRDGHPPAPQAARPPTRHRYGDDPSQVGDLYLPATDRGAGTVVMIHGGFWQDGYTLDLNADVSADLAGRGYAVWNLEYRRVGGGGGWPATFDDVGGGIDHLAELDVDVDAVVAVGHSAGGHLAAWAAGRGGLPPGVPGSDPKVTLRAAVAQAGVLDLAGAADAGVGGSAVPELLGGLPDTVRTRYAVADPLSRVPVPAAVRCVHSAADAIVPLAQSQSYVAAATSAGGDAALVEVGGDHFALIDPGSDAWATTAGLLPALFAS